MISKEDLGLQKVMSIMLENILQSDCFSDSTRKPFPERPCVLFALWTVDGVGRGWDV